MCFVWTINIIKFCILIYYIFIALWKKFSSFNQNFIDNRLWSTEESISTPLASGQRSGLSSTALRYLSEPPPNTLPDITFFKEPPVCCLSWLWLHKRTNESWTWPRPPAVKPLTSRLWWETQDWYVLIPNDLKKNVNLFVIYVHSNNHS